MNKKIGWKSIVLYVLAVLMAVYTIYAFVGAYQYIDGYVEYGTISYAANFGEIMSYYVSSVATYLFYAVAFAVMASVLAYLEGKKAVPAEVEAVEAEKEEVVEVAQSVAVVSESAAEPVIRYCQNCYHVFQPDDIPEFCPECGAKIG